MPKAKVNNIELEYDTFGNPSSEAILLIMGLGAQMIVYEPEFCQMLVDRGFYPIRFDNRDVGLSTKLETAGRPNIMKLLRASQNGKKIEAAYTLNDMADDAAGLLTALNIDKAHVCGVSMGGAIAQQVAVRHPNKVLSLVSMMSSTGNPDLPPPKPEALQILTKPVPTEREAFIKESIRRRKVLHGPIFPFDEEKARIFAETIYDRSFYPEGTLRQMAAILATGDRRKDISKIKCPTLIVHGSADPLVSVEAAQDTTDNIEGAKVLIIEGMGHSLPVECWNQVLGAFSENAAKAHH